MPEEVLEGPQEGVRASKGFCLGIRLRRCGDENSVCYHFQGHYNYRRHVMDILRVINDYIMLVF